MPVFPQPYASTTSHWQATNRGPTSLWNHGRHATLPAQADYVIIGAGITGCSLAYQLTRADGAGAGKSVVVLDAKDVASCASGRNGGHIAPRSWELFRPLVAALSEGGAGLTAQEALDVMFFEQSNLDLLTDIVAKEGLDVNFWRGFRHEIITTEEGREKNYADIEAFKAALAASKDPKRKVLWELIDDPAEAQKLARLPNALQINRGPGASWHPHRGVTALLKLALASTSSKCSFFSWAPVRAITERSGGGWTVDCAGRGKIAAGQVVLATNAYTSHLADIGRFVIPYRGHAGVVTPTPSYAGPAGLQTSYSVERGPYLIETPDGGYVLGPFNATVLSVGIGGPHDMYGLDDDSVVKPRFRQWLENWCKDSFVGWGEEAPGEGLMRAWSGIMAHTVDLMPLVGPVPGKPGLWACVSYNGHGMAKALATTRSLAHHIKTGKWDDRMPRRFAITEERLARAAGAKPPIPWPACTSGTRGSGKM